MLLSCDEIRNSFDGARQAFREVMFPASKQVLINEAKGLGLHSDVMQAIRSLPDRKYYSSDDAIVALDTIQSNLQSFICLEYPVTRKQLIEVCGACNAPNEVIRAIKNCPDTTYDSFGDVINRCGCIVYW